MSKVFSWPLTFCSVVFAWVFFRAESFSSAMIIVRGMLGLNGFYFPPHWFGKYILIQKFFGECINFNRLYSSKTIFFAIFLSIPCIMILPNVIELMAKYKPALNISEKNIETKILKYVNYYPNYMNDLVLAVIASAAIMSISKTSEFLYFQF